YAARFTGRKRFQAETRASLPPFADVEGKLRINPLARWQAADIEAYLERHRLRRHPPVAHGYRSIGCAACTRPVAPREDARAGRGAGFAKTECGIHNRPGGRRVGRDNG